MARQLRAYTLPIVVELAEGSWRAFCPTLLDYGAASWGATREEALDHIREVVGMIVRRMAEDGASIPIAPADHEPGERIVVTVRVPILDAPHPA